jgi:hypothetical protein
VVFGYDRESLVDTTRCRKTYLQNPFIPV